MIRKFELKDIFTKKISLSKIFANQKIVPVEMLFIDPISSAKNGKVNENRIIKKLSTVVNITKGSTSVVAITPNMFTFSLKNKMYGVNKIFKLKNVDSSSIANLGRRFANLSKMNSLILGRRISTEKVARKVRCKDADSNKLIGSKIDKKKREKNRHCSLVNFFPKYSAESVVELITSALVLGAVKPVTKTKNVELKIVT